MARRNAISIEGVDELLAALTLTSNDIVASAREAMKTGAEMLKQRIHDYAPLDEGDLEDSVKIMNSNLGQKAARQGEMSIEVGIDPSRMKRSRPDVVVADYAHYMEEGMFENLGPKSEMKDEEIRAFYSRDGGYVGKYFFSRAVEDAEPYIRKVINEKISKAVQRGNRRATSRKR